jgi:hypothetical protein
VTLRWLAGGSHIDLCFAWGIGYSTFYSERGVLWPAIEAIDEVFHIGLPIDDIEKLEKLSQGFHAQSNGLFDGLIMVMDGLAVRTRAPFKDEVPKRKDYRFRKGGFAIIALAGCDADAKTTVAVPMTSLHGTIVISAKQLSTIDVSQRSISLSVTRLSQILISVLVHGQAEG